MEQPTEQPTERTLRRRGAEPVRYAQLQALDIEMSKLRYQQQLRKGEKRRLESSAKSNDNGNGGTSNDSKKSRAEARRTVRQARRRGAMSPRSDADSESALWQSLPSMALDGSGPQSRRFTNPEDAVHTTVSHPTSWRRVQLSETPTNLLPTSVMDAFSLELDQPLDAYSPELASACTVIPESAMKHNQSLDANTTDDEVHTTVRQLLSDAEPRMKEAHAKRVAHVLEATRRSVRACLQEITTIRQRRVPLIQDKLVPLASVTPLERVTTAKLLTNIRPPTSEELVDVMPTYAIGRGESTIRERPHLPKELVLLHRLPTLSRSTTCIGVHTTLPVDDDPIIRYVPQFTHGTKAGDSFPSLEAVHKAAVSALDTETNEFMLRFVVNGVGGDVRAFRVLKELAWAMQPQSDYRILQRRTGVGGWEADRVGSVRRKLACTNIPLSPHRGLAAFRRLFCRRCYVYNCQLHGADQPPPQTRIDPIFPTVKTVLRQQNTNADSLTTDTNAINSADANSSADSPQDQVAVKTTSVKVSITTEEEVTLVNNDGDIPTESEVVRRSVRSVTAAATKASAILVSQQRKPTPTSRRTSSAGSRSTKKEDASEYLGYDELYQRVIGSHRAALLKSNDGGCSPLCHKTQSTNTDANANTCPPASGSWSLEEFTVLYLAKKIVGANACAIAALVQTKSCHEVHRQLSSPSVVDRAISASIYSSYTHDHVASVRANSQEHLQRTRFQRMKDRGSNHQYLPCSHAGSCDTNLCSCMRRDHFCEKSCGCTRDCANRFPGCRCARGECRTLACPCFFSGRECDPHVCGSCGACEIPVLALDPERQRLASSKLRVCANTNILRGAHRRIGMAESTTHGWGAYALEEIAEGDFIYEYTGELLTQDEAERRGNVYDRNAVSFLFDLNEDAVVDAARKGNKSKFANHSATDANCAPRIMSVNGDHRIGLYAKCRITTGEELFFDYGHHGVVPDWSQSRIRSNGVGATAWSAPTLPTTAAPTVGSGSASPNDSVEAIDMSDEEENEQNEEEPAQAMEVETEAPDVEMS